MQTTFDPYSETALQPTPAKRSFWQKLGGTSLTVSLLVHATLVVVAAIWVFKIIEPAEKNVSFLPKSGGGGTPSSERKSQQRRVQLAPPNLSRVVAIGATGISLPEPDPLTAMASMAGPSSSLDSMGRGGPGSGGGKGTGHGQGLGDGWAMGNSNGTGSKNPFGMAEASLGGLPGTFYDLKQTKDLKPTEMTDAEFRTKLKEIVQRGLKDRDLAKFYKAPSPLYQTKFMIPRMSAEGAPAAFQVEKFVPPRRWLVIYRGAVKAPKSGHFRLVGAGDDVLLVRFNNRLMFDYGYTLAATGGGVGVPSAANYNKNKKSDEIREFKRLSPMPVPTINYQYSTTDTINKALGGVAVGPEFQVTAGTTYPIEILISEIPGGLFSTALLIQEDGVNYPKDPSGSPILPLFRLDRSSPDPKLEGEAPPYDPNGPVWETTESGIKRDI